MNEYKERCQTYWRDFVDRTSEMMGSSSFAYSAWHLSLLMVLWGIWMIVPGTFIGPPYDVMSLLASEFAWGGIAIVLGASKMHFVFCKKSISLSVLNLISGYFWSIVGVSFLMSAPYNTGFPVYMMLGFYEFWLYKRLTVRKD